MRRKRSLAAAYGGRCFVKEPPTAARLRRESHCLTPVSYKRSFFQVGERVGALVRLLQLLLLGDELVELCQVVLQVPGLRTVRKLLQKI